MSGTCRPTEAASDTGPYDKCPYCGWVYQPDAIHWCPKSWEAWKKIVGMAAKQAVRKAKPSPEGGREDG